MQIEDHKKTRGVACPQARTTPPLKTIYLGNSLTNFSNTPTRTAGKLFKKLALAAALSVCSFAQAEIINFEDAPAFPFAISDEQYVLGNFTMTPLSAAPGDNTGLFIDGADQADICQNAQCPVNNQTKYYASLNDSYFLLNANNGGNFKVNGFRASFMGNGVSDFNAVFGLLLLQGFGQDGRAYGGPTQVLVPGKNALGQYNFDAVNIGLFSQSVFVTVRFLAFGCDANGNCLRNVNAGNIAIDDIDVTIPEPATLGLFGLGLLGLGAFSRKRAA